MEAHYIGFNMWVKAVEKAKTTNADKVIAALPGIKQANLTGGVSEMLPNHYITKPVFIGEIRADGQFDVVWKTKGLGARRRLVALSARVEGPDRGLGEAQLRQLQHRDQDLRRYLSHACANVLTPTSRGGGVASSVQRPGNIAMRFGRACLVALALAFGFALGVSNAHAASLDDAIAHFTADDFDETLTGVNEVVASDSPRAEIIISALQNGQLMFSAEKKAVYVQDADGKLFDAATGEPVTGEPPADLDSVHLNNRLRGAIDAAIGQLTLLSHDPDKRYEAAQAVFKSRAASALPTLEKALAEETDGRVKVALEQARAAILLTTPGTSEADKLKAIAIVRDRGDQDALGLLSDIPAHETPGCRQGRERRDRRHPNAARGMGCGAKSLVRAFARLGSFAGGHRPCHHLRRHGRHQHGARRNGDARRLCHLCRAGDHPQQCAGAVRLLAGDRHSARVRVRRLRRHIDRTLHHPLSLWAAAWRRCSRPGDFR